MPMSRCLKNDMRSAKKPKTGSTVKGDGSAPDKTHSSQYKQNSTTPQKSKAYKATGSSGSVGKLVI